MKLFITHINSSLQKHKVVIPKLNNNSSSIICYYNKYVLYLSSRLLGARPDLSPLSSLSTFLFQA